jgi:hydroxyethylthiazole kinase-like uncharacterized protein yjeF
MRVLTAAQMREADRRTIDVIGVPSVVLMENAGRQVVSAMEAAFGELADSRVAILAGRGNNGGDGFVVARTLAQRGVDVHTYVIGDTNDIRGDARLNLDILERLVLPVIGIATNEDWKRHEGEILAADVIVDALFGTGLATPLSGLYETVVDDVNDSDVPVVAVDIPSGLSADQREPIGPHIFATLTVTMATPKYPLVLPPSEDAVGTLVVADIGIPREVIDGLDGDVVRIVDDEELAELIQPRASDTHKGSFGHVLIVAGSRGKTGAAHLAAMGALRCGAGLVTVATPDSCVPIVAALGAEYMTMGLPEQKDGALASTGLAAILETSVDVIAIGPGIGTGPGAAAIVEGLVTRAAAPLVLDADAINVLAGRSRRLSGIGRPVVMTPHPGELARLMGTTIAEVQRDRIGAARTAAREFDACVILKGYRTVIATPDGQTSINMTGNPGMATGGSGDTLTGMLAAWMGQLSDTAGACQLAVHLHGAAGDLAAARYGEVAMTAGDVASHIADAIRQLIGEEPATDDV